MSLKGKLKSFGNVLSQKKKKKSNNGNLREALKHWKDLHLGKEKYAPHEAPENKTGTSK